VLIQIIPGFLANQVPVDIIRDVVLGLGPWSLVVLKDKIGVLGPSLGLEA